MMEIILEAIAYFFVEIIFQGIIMRVIRGIKSIGIIILKLVTLSKESVEELKVKYKDSSKPYFIGCGATIGIIYLLLQI